MNLPKNVRHLFGSQYEVRYWPTHKDEMTGKEQVPDVPPRTSIALDSVFEVLELTYGSEDGEVWPDRCYVSYTVGLEETRSMIVAVPYEDFLNFWMKFNRDQTYAIAPRS